MGRAGGGLDSPNTLTRVASLGRRAGQQQERMDGNAWRASIQALFWQGCAAR